MSRPPFVSFLPVAFAALAALPGCAGTPEHVANPNADPGHPSDARGGGAPRESPAQQGAVERDPKIVALASAALGCKFDKDQGFDRDCPAYKAWEENTELIADAKGDATIFAMIGDRDERLRLLASRKGMNDALEFFSDEGHVKRLFELARNERNPDVGRKLAGWIARVDTKNAGVADDLRALAKHPVPEFRKELTSAIAYHADAPQIDVITALLEDGDKTVREEAIYALSTGGMTAPAPGVCKLLEAEIGRTDDLAAQALWSGSSSKCEGIQGKVLDELAKRVAEPAKITGVRYAHAVENVCGRVKTDALKKKGFAIGTKLADAKIPDRFTRSAAFSALAACDAAAAPAVIRKYAGDRDKVVAVNAKEKLTELKGKKK